MDEIRRNASGFRISRWITYPVGAIIALFILFGVLDLDGYFGYFGYQVSDKEVGIKFSQNQPIEIVGPGWYSQAGFLLSMKSIKTEGLSFTADDEEVLTKDQQRIGVIVQGTVHRPGLDKAKVLLDSWSQYGSFYQRDELLIGVVTKTKDAAGKEVDKLTPGLMQALGQQAIKVCVGDSDFKDAVVGSARDKLRDCVDTEIDKLAKGYGLEVRNIVVPNIILSNEVRSKMDEITQSRFATDVATQAGKQAREEALRDQTREEGKIRVQQAQIQERAKQDAITAELDQKAKVAVALSEQAIKVAQAQSDQESKVAQSKSEQTAAVAQALAREAAAQAQLKVIEANKANENLEATKNLQIAAINRQIKEEAAKADIAPKVAEAAVYQNNSQYTDLKKTEALAAAWNNTDKVIVPAGTSPVMVIGNNNPQVTVPAR